MAASTSSIVGSILDSYSRRARLAPVFLAALPALGLVLALIPTLPAWHKLWPVLAGGGLLALVDQLGRDAGRRLQPALWASWGGAPATAMLRHAENPNPVLLARRHRKLETLMGESLPTEQEEQADRAAADHAYEAAVTFLIQRTRSRETFPLVFTENRNYGFRRNMLGLRPWGRRISAASAAVALGALIGALFGWINLAEIPLVVVLVASVTLLVIWNRTVTPEWVRRAADAYAARLLEAIETLT
jgi:hypothetical protein